jgi:hypothetical protein
MDTGDVQPLFMLHSVSQLAFVVKFENYCKFRPATLAAPIRLAAGTRLYVEFMDPCGTGFSNELPSNIFSVHGGPLRSVYLNVTGSQPSSVKFLTAFLQGGMRASTVQAVVLEARNMIRRECG